MIMFEHCPDRGVEEDDPTDVEVIRELFRCSNDTLMMKEF